MIEKDGSRLSLHDAHRACRGDGLGRQLHMTPSRPLWTGLKGFGSKEIPHLPDGRRSGRPAGRAPPTDGRRGRARAPAREAELRLEALQSVSGHDRDRALPVSVGEKRPVARASRGATGGSLRRTARITRAASTAGAARMRTGEAPRDRQLEPGAPVHAELRARPDRSPLRRHPPLRGRRPPTVRGPDRGRVEGVGRAVEREVRDHLERLGGRERDERPCGGRLRRESALGGRRRGRDRSRRRRRVRLPGRARR